MKNEIPETNSNHRRPAVLSALREGLLVAVIGLGFALTANQISPRGLSLTRNYFPVANAPAGPVIRQESLDSTNLSPAEALVAQIKSAGFQPASSNQVVAWFADPGRQNGKIVFVDARNEDEFHAGHIPSAWVFDPYHPEKYLPGVMPVCQSADQVVVYCHGGDCDDSLSAATLLRDVGIPPGKIAIYAGGMAEWLTTGRPVEKNQ